MWVGDETAGHVGDVDETVLVDSDVDEGAEGRDVGDGALENHAGLKIGDLFHAFLEGGGDELGTRIAARLVQLSQDVLDGGQADAGGLVDEVRSTQLGQDAGVADELLDADASRRCDGVDDAVGLRVHS